MNNNRFFKTIVFFLLLIVIYFIFKLFSHKNSYSNYKSLINKDSSCINCHTTMQGFAPAHAPNQITCVSCHLGNNSSLKKDIAHKKMLQVPGNLSNASQTCAKCHTGIDLRVKNSLMNTMSGIISVDKYVFGENDSLNKFFNIHHLEHNSPATNHLRNKCASCHIGNEKEFPDPINEKSRGGGCTACHLNYDKKTKIAHINYINSGKVELTKFHPSLSLKVTDNHCFGCHSRSGRISTNYEGLHETLLKPNDVTNSLKYRILEDNRVFEKRLDDVHHAKGLSCIDCHDSYDVMGNGTIYAHKEDAVHSRCTDCHFSNSTKIISYAELEEDEKRIIKLRNIDTTNLFLIANNKTILNVIYKEDQLFLLTKNSSKKLKLSKPNINCSRNVHKNVSCSTCHTSWSPQCISCHTSFDDTQEGFDLLDKKWITGKWIEQGNDFLAEFPTLGIVEKENKKVVKTFAPGMVMSLQKQKNEVLSFHRLFAPVSAHTISAKGNTCKTCHNNPVALGYGRGELTYTKNGIWIFKPKYQKSEDGLPKDAWIRFLKNDTVNKATRNNTRPFTLKEQKKILRVGACLTCHKENSAVVNSILTDFKNTLQNISSDCITPVY